MASTSGSEEIYRYRKWVHFDELDFLDADEASLASLAERRIFAASKRPVASSGDIPEPTHILVSLPCICSLFI